MADHTPEDWFRRTLRQAPWRTQTQTTSLVLAVVVIVLVIGALYLAQASRTAAIGRRLQELEARRQTLEQQNAQLRAEIAALRSVPRLIAEAERMGFHVASQQDVEYLLITEAPPPVELTPASPPEISGTVPAYDETLESWLSVQLKAFREQFSDLLQRTFGAGQEPPPDA
ncbi:MAG TPA: hypothetical protein ENI95_09420 [Chloroflexi bacterium]|nr:hypothetical protein [Chloroflexota bacterium]